MQNNVPILFEYIPEETLRRKKNYFATEHIYVIDEGELVNRFYKACPSESGTEVGAPLFPAVELCD
jgi:hypothetical protein